MPRVIPVKFAYMARDLWFDQALSEAQEGDHVICSTERGTEIGLATHGARDVSRSELQKMIGNAVLKSVIRVADDFDLERADELARRGDEAMPVFRQLVSQSGLDMKPVGVEYLFGGEKVVCYFAAEERIDFRQLVRELSHELHERIDMRQIGVREEAAVTGGFGHCGQELCCSRFGLSFEPVSIRMAKEQDLPLTSNKISGACGRLMCCLRYEFDAYRDFKGRAPKRNAVIDTPLGKAKVIEYDTPKEELALRIESGKVVRIPLAEMVASDAAVKKSNELGCACRPDTVVRSSLEKLSSPDVQMALAELDRKMGVVPKEAFDESDLFVETKTKRRRGRGKETARATDASDTTDVQEQQAEAPQKKTRRRRRRSQTGENRGAQAVAAQPKPEPAKPAQEPRRRRRHRAADASQETPTARPQARPQQAEGRAQKPQQTRTRRRPGDKAGQKAQLDAAQAAGARREEGQASEAPVRRHRRRRRPSQGKGGAGEQATS